MALETFNFPFHSLTWSYPKGTEFQFGKGYRFAARPQLPQQRIFKLRFESMVWERNAAGQPDATINPETNIWALIQFFERHLNHKTFIYPSGIYGNLTVRFSADREFETPKGTGGGAVEGFDIELLECPL